MPWLDFILMLPCEQQEAFVDLSPGADRQACQCSAIDKFGSYPSCCPSAQGPSTTTVRVFAASRGATVSAAVFRQDFCLPHLTSLLSRPVALHSSKGHGREVQSRPSPRPPQPRLPASHPNTYVFTSESERFSSTPGFPAHADTFLHRASARHGRHRRLHLDLLHLDSTKEAYAAEDHISILAELIEVPWLCYRSPLQD